MVGHPHVLEQPVLVQTFTTIVTVVSTEKEVAMLDVFSLATGVKHHRGIITDLALCEILGDN